MRYVVSLSGGIASAVAADRAIERYGRNNVDLWFADTMWEDEDLYRFLDNCIERWGGFYSRERVGMNPLEVAESERIIPNQKIATCSRVLKQKPFKVHLLSLPKPVTVLLGLDWKEMHRHEAPRNAYEAVGGVSVDFPLLWPPLEADYASIIASWGIEIPRLYKLGFPHNNCGGRCVRQGQKEWLRLRDTFPERFAEVRDWEARQQALGDNRANYAILRDRTGGTLKPLSLAELERRNLPVEDMPEAVDDRFGCFCEV